MFKKLRIKKRTIKFIKQWNTDAEIITKWINNAIIKDAAFKWNQLVTQEIFMWIRLDKNVDEKEMEWMSDMRGFDQQMKTYCIETLKVLGLYVS